MTVLLVLSYILAILYTGNFKRRNIYISTNMVQFSLSSEISWKIQYAHIAFNGILLIVEVHLNSHVERNT